MDDHNHCGDECNHNHETIIITLEDNSEVECNVLGVFDVEEKAYIALMPLGEEEVLIYTYEEDGENLELNLIESDEEFEKVSDAFYELFEFEGEEFDDFDLEDLEEADEDDEE